MVDGDIDGCVNDGDIEGCTVGEQVTPQHVRVQKLLTGTLRSGIISQHRDTSHTPPFSRFDNAPIASSGHGVGKLVGVTEGLKVGLGVVGAGVGWDVGLKVGLGVGNNVGDGVGGGVGDKVGGHGFP